MLLHASRIFRRFPRPGYFLNFRKKLLTNSAARPGDVLLLTKPLGIGVLTTAAKAGLASPEAMALGASVTVTLPSAAPHG